MFLGRDDAGRAFVRHKANAPSGGTITDIDVGAFLERGPAAPEHAALLQLIGTLAEDERDAGPT